MRVGVIILPQFTGRELAARWKSLEDKGFAHGWSYDHLAWRTLADEPWYATVPTLAAAALATARIGIGFWVASPNFRHPVPFAKDLLSLDDLSGGRMIAAVGAGGLGWDSAVLGRPELAPRQRVDRLTEFVALTDLLLRQSETTWRGEYFAAEKARMQPAGARRSVRLVIAGAGPRTIRLAASYDGLATTGPVTADSPQRWWSGLAAMIERYRGAVRELGDRAPDTPERTVSVSIDSAPGPVPTSAAEFADIAGRAAGLGVTDLLVHWPRESGVYAGDPALLDGIAEQLRGGVWTG